MAFVTNIRYVSTCLQILSAAQASEAFSLTPEAAELRRKKREEEERRKAEEEKRREEEVEKVREEEKRKIEAEESGNRSCFLFFSP